MRKNNNKGFTLLELLISIFILTTVIFIGYNIINKSTTYIQNRKNIHQGQLAVNDINVYLMDDLKCATSVAISLNEINTFTDSATQRDPITNETLKEEFEKYLEDTKNDSSTDIKFTYKYNINYKKDENETKIITYNVDIIKDNNNYKYSISREVTNEVLITFITNKILTDEVLSRDDKLPLKIELESPYEVTLGYNGKNNDEFVEHQFAIASRLYEMSYVGNEGTGGNEGNEGTGGNEGTEGTEGNEGGEGTGGNEGNENGGSTSGNLNGDLIFELTKLNQTQNTGEYYWKREVKYNMLDKIPSSETQTNKHNGYSENFNILLKNDSNSSIEAHIGGQGNTTIYDNRIQNIIGMKIKLDGDIKITDFSFPNYQTTILDDTTKIYEFKGLHKQQHNISGKIVISSNGSVGDKSRLIIDFIYNE